jgi:hypothetical protein
MMANALVHRAPACSPKARVSAINNEKNEKRENIFHKNLDVFAVPWYINKRSSAWRGKSKGTLNQKGLQGACL